MPENKKWVEALSIIGHEPHDLDFLGYKDGKAKLYLVVWKDGIETWENAFEKEREVPYLVNQYWWKRFPQSEPETKMNRFVKLEGFMVRDVIAHHPKSSMPQEDSPVAVTHYKIQWSNSSDHFNWEKSSRLRKSDGARRVLELYWKNKMRSDKFMQTLDTTIDIKDSSDSDTNSEVDSDESSSSFEAEKKSRLKQNDTDPSNLRYKTPEQLEILESALKEHPGLPKERAEQLSLETGLSTTVVRQWFGINRHNRGIKVTDGPTARNKPQKVSNQFTPEVSEILQKSFDKNQYPEPEVKILLMKRTKLDKKQLSNWFSKARLKYRENH